MCKVSKQFHTWWQGNISSLGKPAQLCGDHDDMVRVSPPEPWCELINQRLKWQSGWQWMGGHGWLHGRSSRCQMEAVVLSSPPPPSSLLLLLLLPLTTSPWSCDQQPCHPHEQAVANSDKMWPCGARQSVRDSAPLMTGSCETVGNTHTHTNTHPRESSLCLQIGKHSFTAFTARKSRSIYCISIGALCI